MRVLISSTPADLELHRLAAQDVVRGLGFEPVQIEAGNGLRWPEVCERNVSGADVLLAIIGWRLSTIPEPELGGDGRRSSTQWEVADAFRLGKAVLVLMATETWPGNLREDDFEARATVRDFRGELDRLAEFFDYEPVAAQAPEPLPGFRAAVHQVLARYQRSLTATAGGWPAQSAGDEPAPRLGGGRDLTLRRWLPPELPENPYPLLLPYTHPDLLAGRERELSELRRLLRLPVPILGLHAPSGAGKSSLLGAGLIPALRAAGQPVAFDRHPHEPGLAGRLLSDLLDDAPGHGEIAGERSGEADARPGHRTFVDRLLEVRSLAGEVAVLVLDQFEDLLRPERRRARAEVGILLAASVQRQPGVDQPPCRWLLAYRQEFHGEVVTWLEDVLRDARSEELPAVSSLPFELSGPNRFHGWPLPLLGTPRSGSERLEEAARVFQAAIEAPLAVRAEGGAPRYPWRFAGDGAARLARAFAETRMAQPAAPLAPELQVVLAHLLEGAGDPALPAPQGGAARPAVTAAVDVEVPDELTGLIDQALEDHLRRALDAAFPAGGVAGREPADRRNGANREGRTRALLALRELADASGRRETGLPADALARAIGSDGREVLEKLASPLTRLLVLDKTADGWCYTLSHDRMAELLVRVVEEEGRFTSPEMLKAFHDRLAVDEEVVALRRFVTLRTELYRSGETLQATRLPRGHFERIETYADVLLWGEERRQWWAACRRRQRDDRRRAMAWRAGLALLVALVAAGVGISVSRRLRHEARLDQVTKGEPADALSALVDLAADPRTDLGELRSRLAARDSPADLFEVAAGGVDEERRNVMVLAAVELALPLLEEAALAEDPARESVLISTMTWALDVFPGRAPRLAARASSLRDEVLGPLRRRRPPPAPPGPDDPDWARVPGGSFLMGASDAGKTWAQKLYPTGPRHQVTVSPFRMLAHEVTREQYRRLVPIAGETGQPRGDLPLAADLPVGVNWYEAYTYAAWLGGRLPTEAEWEYAARADCRHDYCAEDGSRTTLDKVGWYRGTASDPETHEASLRPVRQLAGNPWGLFDMYGNALEWTADWYAPYSAEPQRDPIGPPGGIKRVMRGGSCWNGRFWSRASTRFRIPPSGTLQMWGFRVVLPDLPEPRS